MKLGKVVSDEFTIILNELMNQPNKKLKVSTMYTLTEIKNKVDEEYHKYEAIRSALLKTYGKKDDQEQLVKSEDGKVFLLEDEKAFQKEFSDLVNIDVALPKLLLSDIGELEVSSADAFIYLRDVLTV